jgi:hypothetical protein
MLPKRISLSIFFFGCAVLFYCSCLHAQQDCNAEVKILLSPTDSRAAAATLGAGKASSGRIYFFDSDDLDLLSQGAIVRLRQGPHRDLTVRLRPPNGNKSALPSEGSACEVDLTGEGENYSYSISNPFDAGQVPQTGYEISRLLSPLQNKMLSGAQVSIDWKRVKRVADIRSTSWQIRDQRPFGKLALELWEWPGGTVLELSTKVRPGAASVIYSELQEFVKMKHLSMSPVQGLKTTVALEAITRAAPQH